MAGAVRYEVTRADYVAAARLAMSPTRRTVVVEVFTLAVGVLVAAVAVYLGHESARTMAIMVTCGLLGAFVCGYAGGQLHAVIGARREFAQHRRLNESTELGWDDNGFRMEGAKGRFACEWRDLVKVRENRRVLLLFPQRRIYLPVPKAAFGSATALDDFGACLENGRTRQALESTGAATVA